MQMKTMNKKPTILRRHEYLKIFFFNICKPNTCVITQDPPLLDLYSTKNKEKKYMSLIAESFLCDFFSFVPEKY